MGDVATFVTLDRSQRLNQLARKEPARFHTATEPFMGHSCCLPDLQGLNSQARPSRLIRTIDGETLGLPRLYLAVSPAPLIEGFITP